MSPPFRLPPTGSVAVAYRVPPAAPKLPARKDNPLTLLHSPTRRAFLKSASGALATMAAARALIPGGAWAAPAKRCCGSCTSGIALGRRRNECASLGGVPPRAGGGLKRGCCPFDEAGLVWLE